MSLRDRASELVDEVRSVTASERTKRLIERFRRVRDGEPWFDKRGLDTIRRRPVDDDSIER
ncbi:4Fe-4S ferredoxin, partial [Halorubrum distributum]